MNRWRKEFQTAAVAVLLGVSALAAMPIWGVGARWEDWARGERWWYLDSPLFMPARDEVRVWTIAYPDPPRTNRTETLTVVDGHLTLVYSTDLPIDGIRFHRSGLAWETRFQSAPIGEAFSTLGNPKTARTPYRYRNVPFPKGNDHSGRCWRTAERLPVGDRGPVPVDDLWTEIPPDTPPLLRRVLPDGSSYFWACGALWKVEGDSARPIRGSVNDPASQIGRFGQTGPFDIEPNGTAYLADRKGGRVYRWEPGGDLYQFGHQFIDPWALVRYRNALVVFDRNELVAIGL